MRVPEEEIQHADTSEIFSAESTKQAFESYKDTILQIFSELEEKRVGNPKIDKYLVDLQPQTDGFKKFIDGEETLETLSATYGLMHRDRVGLLKSLREAHAKNDSKSVHETEKLLHTAAMAKLYVDSVVYKHIQLGREFEELQRAMAERGSQPQTDADLERLAERYKPEDEPDALDIDPDIPPNSWERIAENFGIDEVDELGRPLSPDRRNNRNPRSNDDFDNGRTKTHHRRQPV